MGEHAGGGGGGEGGHQAKGSAFKGLFALWRAFSALFCVLFALVLLVNYPHALETNPMSLHPTIQPV